MEYVRGVGRGFFPLDEALELLPGALTPHGHECLVRLSGWMPFEKAAEIFRDMMGIKVSKGMSQRYTESAGRVYEQMEEEEVERIEREAPEAEKGADKIQVSADGAMVSLLHGVWAEVRTVAIGEIQVEVEKSGEREIHARNLSYFSRKVNADTFQRLALVEMHRRGIEKAKAVAAVMDGAEWEQSFTDYHCPNATRILDFPHAAEHMNGIGEALYGEHTPESQAWLEEHLHCLKHAGPEELLLELGKLVQEKPGVEAIASNFAYLLKRKDQLRYPQFQAQGWPIGSGMVESGNKLVVEARLKGSGMHWAEQHVNPMLAIRNIIYSDRWKTEWPRIEVGLRKRARLRQRQLHQKRIVPPPVSTPPPKPEIDEQTLDAVFACREQKPQTNPWRKFKCGKALYQQSAPPKN